MRTRTLTRTITMLITLAALGVHGGRAEAGCGCTKPPPPPATVRPSVAYPGVDVTFFGSALQVGQEYTVQFTSSATGATASAKGKAASRRDLADGIAKTQLTVSLPKLPPGPASMTVTGATAGGVVLSIGDASLTVTNEPLTVPASYGTAHTKSFQAGIGRDGTMYVALDLNKMGMPVVIDAQTLGYPLRFSSEDVAFYNAQGFLMQRLVTTGAEPVPGMFVFPAENPAADSDRLHYSRHEFSTYFLQHAERQPHAVDRTDKNWHVDGTRHVDHDHLILAIRGHLNGGALPAPGATPPLDLVITTSSLFYRGVSGLASVQMDGDAIVDSFTPGSPVAGTVGDVLTNGTLTLKNKTTIQGNASAKSFKLSGQGIITGRRKTLSTAESFMDVNVPATLPDLGKVKVARGETLTLLGPGSFRVTDLSLEKNGLLFADNLGGPVTLYVIGDLDAKAGSAIAVANPDPEQFAIYVSPMAKKVSIDLQADFYGVIYAPNTPLALANAHFYGAFVGSDVDLSKGARVHYDSLLRGSK